MNTLADNYGTRKEDTFKRHTIGCLPNLHDLNILQAEYTGFKHQGCMMRYFLSSIMDENTFINTNNLNFIYFIC